MMLTRRGFLQSFFALCLLLVGTLGNAALTERYVSALADGSGDGTTITAPMTWAQMATELTTTTTARAGNRYNVKADGTYSLSASNTFAAPGTVGSPIILRGYKTTIGDGYLGRTNGNGALITTNMPTVAYGATYLLAISGAYIQFESINTTFSRNNFALQPTGAGFCIKSSVVTNAQNDATASGISMGSADGTIFDCDVSCSSPSSSGTVISLSAAMSIIVKSRINGPKATIGVYVGSRNFIVGCVFLPSTGTGIEFASNESFAIGNTIYSQATTAIRTPNSSQTNTLLRLIENNITDCGRAMLNQYNATAAHPVFSAFNRTRDNTNADLGFGDWPYYGSITTDTGGPETDYVDAANGDLRLIQASPAYGTAPGGGNIGAAQNRYESTGTAGYSRGRINR